MRYHVAKFSVALTTALIIAACVARGLAVEPLLAQTCTVVLDQIGATAPAEGATITVTVTPNPPTCDFAVSQLSGAGSITRGAGNTAVVTIPPNPDVAREARFEIGDMEFRVVQAGTNAPTPWNIGDVFVGAGSYADSPGVYKTLAPQGSQKLQTGSAAPVPDLLDGAGNFTNGCMVDPTVPNGHLFTAAWTANTLSIFDAGTQQLRDVFRFSDPSTYNADWDVALNTPLAAIPRAGGVPRLPDEAIIGTPDNPATADTDEFVPPEIQGFEQIVFAANGDFYVGTTAPNSDPYLPHGYLLRFRYTPAEADKLTLTGWWRLDTGAETPGVDQFDLSSDQETIFYTSEDNFIRRFNVDAPLGTPPPAAIQLKNPDGSPFAARAYGLRILPGLPDAAGNAMADGSGGFIVATSTGAGVPNFVLRVDATGTILARYQVDGQPFAVNLSPDAQHFWTAMTQDVPEDPRPEGGTVYRFAITSGARESFEPGTTGVYGLCVKREYSAATTGGQCFTRNDDGSYGPATSACRMPPVCSPGSLGCFNSPPELRNPGTITLQPGQLLPTLVCAPTAPSVPSFMAMHQCAPTPIVLDPDAATDTVHVFTTGLPTGLALPSSTSYGNGWHLPLTGTAPTTLGPEGKVEVTIIVCDDAGLARDSSGEPSVPFACDPDSSHTRTETFTIQFNRPPVCSDATVTPKLLWPPNHKLVPFSIRNVTDPDGDALTIVITSITQDQPVNDKGDGNTGFDATGVGTSRGAVRAERTGNLRVPGDGRLYQVNFTASDGKIGGTCGGTVAIGVPHDQGQRNLPTDNGCRWNSVTGVQEGPCAWLNAPVLAIANRSSAERVAITEQITAADPDGTPLTYSATSLPPGLSMSPSGLITGTITSGAAGGKSKKYAVTVNVSDGYGTVKSTFTWTITRP